MTHEPERGADILAIMRLTEAFCHELDRGSPEAFADLFTEQALYTHGARCSEGRSAILAFAQQRISAGVRTSRHFACGLRVTFAGPSEARGVSCCTTFAASAPPPIASTLPALVADFHDRYQCVEGSWRFAERHIVPIFTPAPA